MKNKLLLSVSVLLIFCLSSCELDNYKAPDAQFFGSVIDYETNEPIQQDLYNGSRIDFRELAYENPNTRQIRFHTEGTFRENNLFSGMYEVQALRGNFFPSEILTMNIKGATEYHFQTLPYIRIHNVNLSFDEIAGVVTGTFNLEQVAPNPVASIFLFADRSVHVCNNFYEAGANMAIGAVVDPEQTFKLEMSTENLVSGKDYYFRVGALISGIAEAKHNYSKTIRLHIDNSNVIPDIPIPGKVLDACESLDGWIGNSAILSLDDVDKKEGNYSISMESTGGELFLIMKAFEPFDSEVTRENGYFAFDMYVSDISMFSDITRFDLTSSGDPDFERLGWTVPTLDLSNGWNKVEVSLAGAGADFRPDAINYFRFFDWAPPAGLIVKFDHFRFYSK